MPQVRRAGNGPVNAEDIHVVFPGTTRPYLCSNLLRSSASAQILSESFKLDGMDSGSY